MLPGVEQVEAIQGPELLAEWQPQGPSRGWAEQRGRELPVQGRGSWRGQGAPWPGRRMGGSEPTLVWTSEKKGEQTLTHCPRKRPQAQPSSGESGNTDL